MDLMTEAKERMKNKKPKWKKTDIRYGNLMQMTPQARKELNRIPANQKYPNQNKHWTEEDYDVLLNPPDNTTYRLLEKKLGRHRNAIMKRRLKLGLPPLAEYTQDGYTVHNIAHILQLSSHENLRRIFMDYRDKRGVMEVRYNDKGAGKKEKNVYLYSGELVWKIFREHKDRIDFSNYEQYDIMPEPDDYKEIIRSSKYKKRNMHVWSMKDMKVLHDLFQQGLSSTEVMDTAAEKLNLPRTVVKNKIYNDKLHELYAED